MKKLLSVLLAISMLATSLTGCGAKNNTTSGSVDPTTGRAKVEIIGVRGEGFVPFSECESLKAIEEKSNLDIKWTDWSQVIQKEKLNLTLNSGQLPDAFYGAWSILTTNDLVKHGSDGQFMDLTPYLNKETMPNFCAIMDKIPGLRKSLTAPSGEIWGLPVLDMMDLPTTNDTLLINTEWLEKVGMEMPTTIDELHEVLKAFKAAGDLNGNGKNDEIPLTFVYNQGNMGLFSLMGFTGLVMNNKNERLTKKDGKLLFMPETEEYKEYLKYMNMLYSEGLVDIEAFTMDAPSYNAKTQTPEPVAGVISAWTADTVNKAIPGFDATKPGVYQYVAPLKGNNGVEPVWIPRQNALNGNIGFMISSASKHGEELCRWIDMHYEPLTSLQARRGKIGLHIKEEGENKFSTIKKEDGKNYTAQEKSAYVPFKHGVAFVCPNEFEFIDKIKSVQDKIEADKVYGPYLAKEFNDISIMKTPQEAEELSYIAPDLFNYVDQMTADFITKGNIDARWDEYLKNLKNLKSGKYVEIFEGIAARG